MWARFTVLNETPIASAIAGCVIPLSRSNTIWMRSRCAAGIFHRSAVFSSRICFLVHLTIRPPESDSQSESYPAPSRDPKKRQKSLDSNSYASGIIGALACRGKLVLLPHLLAGPWLEYRVCEIGDPKRHLSALVSECSCKGPSPFNLTSFRFAQRGSHPHCLRWRSSCRKAWTDPGRA